MQENHRILAWTGCAPILAAAVATFCDRWAPYSTKSRAYPIFKLYEEVIEPAWNAYLAALPLEHNGRVLCRDLKFAQLARAVGFSTVETLLASTIRTYCKSSSHIDLEFDATLETLLIVARECHSKRPKKLNSGRSNRIFQEFCEHCGANSELWDQAKGRSRTGYEPEGAARLSAKYCWDHRPKFLDGTRNPQYLWAVRSKATFDEEFRRLRLQSRSMARPLAKTGDVCLDLFYLNVLAPHATFPDEVAILRNEARKLVDSGMDDRKKRIVVMRASGFTLTAIADATGVKSRQAISKSLASVPSIYRFDLG